MSPIIYLGLFLFTGSVYSANNGNVFCYFSSWAIYRSDSGKFDVEDIDPNLCSHVLYAYLGINSDGSIKILDTFHELELLGLQRFVHLKERNPKLKVMISVGGWNEGSIGFSNVASHPLLRNNFANNVLQFCEKYGFDGFDLSWEYPAQRGGAATDKANFVLLLKELHNKLSPKGILLTATVGATANYIVVSYDVPNISRYVDFILLMSYDLHGAYEGVVGLNAPLYAGETDVTIGQKMLNVNSAVHSWLQSGAPKNKLILGIPLFGRTFTLLDPTKTGIGAPATAGKAGPYTQETGFLGYNEICKMMSSENWTRIWQKQEMVPYAVFNENWISYDDIESVTIKAQYVKEMGLAGAMVWSMDTDDFLGKCGNGKFPLLHAINYTFRSTVAEELNGLIGRILRLLG